MGVIAALSVICHKDCLGIFFFSIPNFTEVTVSLPDRKDESNCDTGT